MNPEEAKKNLDSQLEKMGYVHPTGTNSSRDPQYMAYNEGGKDVYFSPPSRDYYATFDTENKKSVQNTDICPVCEQKAMYSCNCSHSDMMCKEGHIWFVMKNGTVKVGDPHEYPHE